jgi:translation initiation factor IF-3
VRVIDSDGSQVGILPTSKALELANKQGLDLVEVAPTARPPVCRIIDFGKFRYEMSKKEKNTRSTAASRVKELKFHLNIDPHDFEIKLNHARGFVAKGMRVKMSLVFRGREMMHAERGQDLITRIQIALGDVAYPEAPPRMIGRAIHLMMVPSHGKRLDKPLPVQGLKIRHSNHSHHPGSRSSAPGFGQSIDLSRVTTGTTEKKP